MKDKNIIGLRVSKARKKSGITQMELAAQMQVLDVPIERSGIAKLETGRRPVSDIEIAAISRILKVSVAWLFEGEETSK